MDCIILPVSALRRRYSQSWGSRRRLSYQPLADEDSNYYGGDEGVVVVVGVGEDKREFIVDPFVLQEDPFRILMDMVISKEGGGGENKKSKLKNGGGKRKSPSESMVFSQKTLDMTELQKYYGVDADDSG
ncbi:hypothetical protein Leryth_004056 [Lithospermum erythrorhizon]|nr:hypothetical protein Leryth_004056 [Lithospermum erythrorhizon]